MTERRILACDVCGKENHESYGWLTIDATVRECRPFTLPMDVCSLACLHAWVIRRRAEHKVVMTEGRVTRCAGCGKEHESGPRGTDLWFTLFLPEPPVPPQTFCSLRCLVQWAFKEEATQPIPCPGDR